VKKWLDFVPAVFLLVRAGQFPSFVLSKQADPVGYRANAR